VVTARAAAVLAVAVLALTACSDPVVVPTAGPNAPGFRRGSPPPTPEVAIATGAPARTVPTGGAVDTVVDRDGLLVITGWAQIVDTPPRGRLEISLPPGGGAPRVVKTVVVPRPDVVAATSRAALTYAGFEVSIEGADTGSTAVCVQSFSSAGDFRLSGSDASLCRTLV
jgi:hypothetical protein